MFDLMLDAPTSGAARLRLAGHLDDAAARDVLHAAADVVRCGCACLVLDLDGLTSWDSDAAFAVVGCTRLARWLPEGVDVVARSDAGRALASHAGVLPADAPPGGAGADDAASAALLTDELVPDTMAACRAC